MFETYGVYVLVVGMVVSLVGYVWLLKRAWCVDWRWAVALVLLPLLIPVFFLVRFRRAAAPSLLLLLGIVLAGGTVAVNLYLANQIDLGAREKIVNGELHITITGWDKPTEEYAVLATKSQLVVLQMANPDVTDETLKYLAELSMLEELDLNDTQITDKGLALLAQLPRLRLLRVRGTHVTDEGFRDYLLNLDSLCEIDARQTEIASKSLREWKNARKEIRRYLK